MTHYEVLGVASDASAAQIRQAYLRLARRFHPDVRADTVAQDEMRRINDAWAVLGDQRRRSDYDHTLQREREAAWQPGTPTPDWVPYDQGEDPDDPAAEFDVAYGDGSPMPRSLQLGPAALLAGALVAGGTGFLLDFAPLQALALVLVVLGLLGFVSVPIFAAIRTHLHTRE
ncbi:MAG: J domain-containing protein [Acidimicrobiia bacterium]|nr:J domain-containing protein [Acidimicrobiia bacterium]